MTKVLHLTPPGFGGIDSYIFSHYRHMDQGRVQFEFLTQNTGLQNAKQYGGFSYKVWLLPATAAKDRDGFVRNVQNVLRNGYDVLHLHTSYWTGFLIEEIAKAAGVRRIIVHSHSTFIDENDPEKRSALLRQHEALKKDFPPDLATDYWACSRRAADWLFGEQIPKGRVKIMKNAIELGRFAFNPEKRTALRAALGLENTLVLGTAGRLTFQKNPAFLIKVFQEFRKDHPNTKLIIVGDGELRGALERQIRERGLSNDVLLLGWRTNVEDYLQAMDCFLLPSRFEGLGIAIMEAAAAGLPCIASEQVPEDVEIAPNIYRVPLKASAWLKQLRDAVQTPSSRYNGTAIVRAAGYDVKEQAKVLEDMYRT